MSKSAIINSNASMGKKAGPAAVKSRLSPHARIIIGAGAVILLLGGLIIAAMPKPGATKPATVESRSSGLATNAGALSALEAKFNFGSISMAAGKVTHRYWIRNAGTEPILLGKMYTSCMCTTAALVNSSGRKSEPMGMPGHAPIPTMNEPMAPKEEVIIEVVFDPAAHGPAGIGPIERTVTIENSAGQPLEIAFAANVTP